MFYNAHLCCWGRCGNIGQDVTDTEATAVENIGVSMPVTLEDVTHTELTAVGIIGVSTLEDGTDTNLTAIGINNTQIVIDNEVPPPNECPLPPH